tara:strand:+ start:310 stop:753 length:444 start_codon:yes stop_codon:yes gene_type:complete
MAQQMRVRDQDIIVKKVVKALEEKGLQNLKDKFSNDSQVKFLKELLEELITIKTKVRELRDQESALEKSIHRGVEDFNTSNDLNNNNGLKVMIGYGYNKDDDRKVFFDFSIDWSVRSEIADALALQTLGSDFNVQDLIASLIAEFSS